jgi:hypothetical protein
MRLCDAYSEQKIIPNNIDWGGEGGGGGVGGGGVIIQIKGKNMKSHFTFHNIWPWL